VSDFIPGRRQDASATIRGFVYQVHLTVLRWLELRDGQVLQLECGEDIDIVTRATAADRSERERLLEQVKHVKRTLTLHAPGAVLAVAAFSAHRRKNTGSNLHFRYTTCASVGREKLSPLPTGTTGIEAWERLRNGSDGSTTSSQLLSGLRTILRTARRPHDAPKQLWHEFEWLSTVADDKALLEIISRLEWSYGQPTVSNMSQRVVAAIRRRGIVGVLPPELQHDILFAGVFRVLSQTGRRELTSSHLDNLLSSPEVSGADSELLRTVEDTLGAHGLRLFAIEQRLEVVESHQRVVRDALQRTGIVAEIATPIELPVLTEPPFVHSLVKRSDTVRALLDRVGDSVWIDISGGIGTGKTHLAGLLSTAFGTQLHWFALRGLEAREALSRVQLTLRQLVGGGVSSAGGYWRSIGHLQPGTVLVFDDFPRVPKGSLEAAACNALVQSCERAGVRMISTCTTPPLTELVDTHAPGHLVHVSAPMFSDKDTADFLLACNAPTPFITDERVVLLRTLSGGHPALLRAAADYLSHTGWRIDRGTLAALLSGAHVGDISIDTSRRVLETVTQAQCRELLYRLSVARDALTAEDIREIADVPPEHAAYLECVQRLEGLWLQPAGLGRYEVSPLVLLFGEQQLDMQTCKAVNRYAGHRVFRNRRIDQIQLTRALIHLIKADEHDQVIGLILRTMLDVRSAITVGPRWPLIFYSPEHALPQEVRASLAMQLRAVQFVASRRVGRDSSAYWESLVPLMRSASKSDHWGLLLSATHLLSAGSYLSFAELVVAAQQLERIRGQAVTPTGETIVAPGWDSEYPLWLVASAIKSWHDFWVWIDLLNHLEEDRLQRALSSSDSVDILHVVVDRLWIAAVEGKDDHSEFQGALRELQRVERWAISHQVRHLIACSIRGQMVIAGEYEGRHDDVEALARRGMNQMSSEEPGETLLELTWGSQLELSGRHADAIPHLEAAARSQHTLSDVNQVFALLAATEAAFALGMPCVDYANTAVAILEAEDDWDVRLKMRVYAEAAVARWFADKKAAAFDAIEAAVMAVFEGESTDESQSLAIRIGHALGFFSTTAALGSPPQRTNDGDDYLPPTPSMFRSHNAAVLQLQRVKTGGAILKSHLAVLAFGVGRTERFSFWSESAFAEASSGGIPAAVVFLAPALLDAQIRSGSVDAAIETAYMAAQAFKAMNDERIAQRDPLRDEFNITLRATSFVASQDDPLNDTAFGFVAFPLVLWIGHQFLVSPEAGELAVRSTIDVIERLERPHLESDQWTLLKRLLEKMLGESSEREVSRYVQTLSQTQTGVIVMTAYILMSGWPTVDYSTSATLQVYALPVAINAASVSAPDTMNRFADWIWTLWESRFKHARLLFSMPSELASDFAAQKTAEPPDAKIRSVLRAVIRSLGVSLDDSTWATLE